MALLRSTNIVIRRKVARSYFCKSMNTQRR